MLLQKFIKEKIKNGYIMLYSRMNNFVLNSNQNYRSIKNHSEFLLLDEKYRFYKLDFKVADGKLVSNNKIVIYEIFIKD